MAGARQSYSSQERRELWARWKKGESVSDIARALGRAPATVHNTVSRQGGVAPLERRRSHLALTLVEREEISRGIAAGWSMRRISRAIGRAPSTVSREIARHGGTARYRADRADRRAWRNVRRPQQCLLGRDRVLRELVADKLREDWSPEQISGWLKSAFPHDKSMRVSHETIYLSLFIQARGALKKELVTHLRRVRAMRSSRLARKEHRGQGMAIDAVSIRERPAQADDRAVPGHWEGDLLIGSVNTQIATLVERQSRFVVLVKIDRRDAGTVADALAKRVNMLSEQLRASLTWDRGPEMAAHKQFTIATNVNVYFCDPQSPWQRGTNENTNGLLRQYFPKKTDVGRFSQEELDCVAFKLNTRPRKTLDYTTPADKLNEVLR